MCRVSPSSYCLQLENPDNLYAICWLNYFDLELSCKGVIIHLLTEHAPPLFPIVYENKFKTKQSYIHTPCLWDPSPKISVVIEHFSEQLRQKAVLTFPLILGAGKKVCSLERPTLSQSLSGFDGSRRPWLIEFPLSPVDANAEADDAGTGGPDGLDALLKDPSAWGSGGSCTGFG